MKKSLFLSAAVAVASSAFASAPAIVKTDGGVFSVGPQAPAVKSSISTRADESFDFTYAESPYTALSLNGTTGGVTRAYMLFEMSKEDIKTFAGSKVTGFTVCSPTDYDGTSNSITDARFFYSTSTSKEDYTQDFNMLRTPFAENKVALDTPYTITGDEETLIFGYSLVVPKKNDMYYVVVDYIPNAENTGIVGLSDDGSFPTEFQSFASAYGALCMSVTLECEKLPQFVSFYSMPYTLCLPLGESTSIPVTVKYTSGSPIESLDIEYTLGGKPYESKFEFPTPAGAGASKFLSFNLEIPAQSEKLNEQVEFRIAKVNGNANESEGAVFNATVVVVDEVPVHLTLYEEYTGTWCGYCPRGFAALEYIKKNYPEFVCASFHSGTQGATDPMQVTSDFPSDVSGFPSAVLNRSLVVDPYYGTQQYDTELPVVGDILALNAVPTAWSVKVSHEWESEDVLVAKAQVANMAGFENRNYRIAYLLVADGLTGESRSWYQTNNYATEKPQFIEELNAFCRGGEYGKRTVSGLAFNDVVVSPNGINGEKGSIPQSLEPEQVAEHSLSFDLSKISSKLIPDRNKLRVIAAVVDPAGVVLNCAKDEVNDYVAGVESVEDSDAPVEYYNLNGVKVTKPTEGVFIRRQGSNVTKVLVK